MVQTKEGWQMCRERRGVAVAMEGEERGHSVVGKKKCE
jgi:hypothetical protein